MPARSFRYGALAALVALASTFTSTLASLAFGDGLLPPWVDAADVPLPTGSRSVTPLRAETPIVSAPGLQGARRGTAIPGVRLPLYGAKRDAGCSGRWLCVGPLAWVCSDAADLSREPPLAPPFVAGEDGLPYRYFFVGGDGAYGFLDLARVEDDSPDQELEKGFGVAVTDERRAYGEAWVLTHHGRWVPKRALVPVNASTFHGAFAGGTGSPPALDFGWARASGTRVYSAPDPGGRSTSMLKRNQQVAWREERAAPGSRGVMVRTSDDGASPAAWVRARDLVRPTVSAPPEEIQAAIDEGTRERWIDVELATQTLTAYEGDAPVFATLVSTGRGAQGTETATPLGAHRIWVKLASSDMDNLDADTGEAADIPEEAKAPVAPYSLEDVPFVQFFDHAVGLHAAFWHDDFGRPHSHGCINLSPRDAAFLFGFTAPHLPAGWTAVLPSPLERGTLVRVR